MPDYDNDMGGRALTREVTITADISQDIDTVVKKTQEVIKRIGTIPIPADLKEESRREIQNFLSSLTGYVTLRISNESEIKAYVQAEINSLTNNPVPVSIRPYINSDDLTVYADITDASLDKIKKKIKSLKPTVNAIIDKVQIDTPVDVPVFVDHEALTGSFSKAVAEAIDEAAEISKKKKEEILAFAIPVRIDEATSRVWLRKDIKNFNAATMKGQETFVEIPVRVSAEDIKTGKSFAYYTSALNQFIEASERYAKSYETIRTTITKGMEKETPEAAVHILNAITSSLEIANASDINVSAATRALITAIAEESEKVPLKMWTTLGIQKKTVDDFVKDLNKRFKSKDFENPVMPIKFIEYTRKMVKDESGEDKPAFDPEIDVTYTLSDEVIEQRRNQLKEGFNIPIVGDWTAFDTMLEAHELIVQNKFNNIQMFPLTADEFTRQFNAKYASTPIPLNVKFVPVDKDVEEKLKELNESLLHPTVVIEPQKITSAWSTALQGAYIEPINPDVNLDYKTILDALNDTRIKESPVRINATPDYNQFVDLWNTHSTAISVQLNPVRAKVVPDYDELIESLDGKYISDATVSVPAKGIVYAEQIKSAWDEAIKNQSFEIEADVDISHLSIMAVQNMLEAAIDNKVHHIRARIDAEEIVLPAKNILKAYNDAIKSIDKSSFKAIEGRVDFSKHFKKGVDVPVVPYITPEAAAKFAKKTTLTTNIKPVILKKDWKDMVESKHAGGMETKIVPVLTKTQWDAKTWQRQNHSAGYSTKILPVLSVQTWKQEIGKKLFDVSVQVVPDEKAPESLWMKVRDYFMQHTIPVKFTIDNNKIHGKVQIVDKDGSVTGINGPERKKYKEPNIGDLEEIVKDLPNLQSYLDEIKNEQSAKKRASLAKIMENAWNAWYRKEHPTKEKNESVSTVLELSDDDEGISKLDLVNFYKSLTNGDILDQINSTLESYNVSAQLKEKYEAEGDTENAAKVSELMELLLDDAYKTAAREITKNARNSVEGQENSTEYAVLKKMAGELKPGEVKLNILDELENLKTMESGKSSEMLAKAILSAITKERSAYFKENQSKFINRDVERIHAINKIVSSISPKSQYYKSALNIADMFSTKPIELFDILNAKIKSIINKAIDEEAQIPSKRGNTANQWQAKPKDPVNLSSEEAMLERYGKVYGLNSQGYKEMSEELKAMRDMNTKGTINKDNFYKIFNAGFRNNYAEKDKRAAEIDKLRADLIGFVKFDSDKYQSFLDSFESVQDYKIKKSIASSAASMYKKEINDVNKQPANLQKFMEILNDINTEYAGHFDNIINKFMQAGSYEKQAGIFGKAMKEYYNLIGKESFQHTDYTREQQKKQMDVMYSTNPEAFQSTYDAYMSAQTDMERDVYAGMLRKMYAQDKKTSILNSDSINKMQDYLSDVTQQHPELQEYLTEFNTLTGFTDKKKVYDRAIKLANAMDRMADIIQRFPMLQKYLDQLKAETSEDDRLKTIKEFETAYGKEHKKSTADPKERKDTFTYRFKDYVRKQIPSLISRSVKGIFNIIGGVLNKIKGAFVKVMKKALDISIKPFTKSVKMFSSAIKKAGGQSKVLSSISELLITPLVLAVEYTLLPVLVKLIPHIKEVITWVVQSRDTFELLGKGISNIVNSLYKVVTGNFILGFENFFKKLEMDRPAIESFYDSFTTLFTDLKEEGITVDNLSDNISGLHTTVQNINEAFKDFGRNEDGKLTFITDFAQEMATAVGETVSTILGGIDKYLSDEKTKTAIQNLMKDVITYILENFQITTKMISGLLESLSKAITDILNDDETGGLFDKIKTNVTNIIEGILKIATTVVGDSKIQSAVWDLIWAAKGIWAPILLTKALGTLMSKGAEYGAGTLIGKIGNKKSGKIPGTTGGIAGGLGGAAAGAGGIAAFGTKIKDGLASIKNTVLNIFGKGVKPVAASNTVKSPWDFAKVGEGFGKNITKAIPFLKLLGGAAGIAGLATIGWEDAKPLAPSMVDGWDEFESKIYDIINGIKVDDVGYTNVTAGVSGNYQKQYKLKSEMLSNKDLYTTNGYYDYDKLKELFAEYGYNNNDAVTGGKLSSALNPVYTDLPIMAEILRENGYTEDDIFNYLSKKGEENPMNLTIENNITLQVDKSGEVTVQQNEPTNPLEWVFQKLSLFGA